jgi:hypothetical protein
MNLPAMSGVVFPFKGQATLAFVRELDFCLQPANFISTSVIPFQTGRRIARIRLQILPCLIPTNRDAHFRLKTNPQTSA